MLPHRRIIPLLLLILLSACGGGSDSNNDNIASVAANYYIDISAGTDSNNGLSAASAWKTLRQLSVANIDTPAVVYLKRGSVWREPLILTKSDITIDAYGSGALPEIDGSVDVTGWLDSGAGIYSHSFTLSDGQALGNLSENNIMLKFIPWDDDVATTFALATTGSYSFDFLLNTLYLKPATLPTSNAYLASLQLRGVYALDLSNITVSNITVSRISLNGIEFHNCVSCGAENVVVKQVGGAVIGANISPSPDFLYAGNGIDFSNNNRNGFVNNVTVSEIFDSCLAVEVYKSNTVATAMKLANAQLAQCGFAGVEISVLSNQATNTNSRVDGLVIDGVIVDKAGKGWSGQRYGIDGHGLRIVADNGAGSMSNIQVNDLSVNDSAGDGIKIAGELGAVYLQRVRVSRNNGIGINIAAPVASSLSVALSASIIDHNGGFGFSYNSPFSVGFKIYQSTFYDNSSINLAIFQQAEVADIRNNIFFSSVTMTHLFSTFILSNGIINNNCYNNGINMFGYGGTAYDTVNSFNLASGLDSNSIGDGVVGLADPANGDFYLTPTSSCQALGDATVGTTNDFANMPFLTPPSSGAFQLN